MTQNAGKTAPTRVVGPVEAPPMPQAAPAGK
jgi:hypothetical protein